MYVHRPNNYHSYEVWSLLDDPIKERQSLVFPQSLIIGRIGFPWTICTLQQQQNNCNYLCETDVKAVKWERESVLFFLGVYIIVSIGIFPWEIRVAFPMESQLRQSRATQPHWIVHLDIFSFMYVWPYQRLCGLLFTTDDYGVVNVRTYWGACRTHEGGPGIKSAPELILRPDRKKPVRYPAPLGKRTQTGLRVRSPTLYHYTECSTEIANNVLNLAACKARRDACRIDYLFVRLSLCLMAAYAENSHIVFSCRY